MPQVMDAGASAMTSELLCRSQPYALADNGEVVSGTTVSETLATIGYEEWSRGDAEKPIPFSGICGQSDSRAGGERDQSGLPELPTSDREDTGIEIDIVHVERDCLTNSDAGDRNQAEQNRES